MRDVSRNPLVLGLALSGAFSLAGALFGGLHREPVPASLGLSPEEREILSHLSLVDLRDGQGGQQRALRISGISLQIVNGSGATGVANGSGNLIVGYNELTQGGDRTGSHNIVCGVGNDYASTAGLVVGEGNQLDAPFAVAIGGSANRVTAPWGAVLGGYNNWAARDFSSVSGGSDNFAFGVASSVGGGVQNDASGDFSSIVGGRNNVAAGLAASILGGGGYSTSDGNRAAADFSVVVGGSSNLASAPQASVSGGRDNQASGVASSVSGGAARAAGDPNQWAAGSLSEAD